MSLRMVLHALACGAGLSALGQGAAGAAVPAAACDHRLGALATWSHGTDTAASDSFWWAEACAFRENLALTVFDNPFSAGRSHVPVPERQEAARTGRLRFQLYFATDRWANPRTGAFEVIPDYYGTVWTQAAVEAGFAVVPGEAKATRYPNHGQQMFAASKGRFGHDLAGGAPGREDVLTALIAHQTGWIGRTFGPCSAGAYRNGQTGAAYAMPAHLLGVRNSGHTGDLSYGRSPRGGAVLGVGRYPDLTPAEASSMVLTTRAGDMEKPAAEILEHCGKLLEQAIATGGWYRDFNHWHTSPRFELDLERFLAEQRRAIGARAVVSLDFGQALQHKFLRDMATVAARAEGRGVRLEVAFHDPYGGLPLGTFHIPLSVRVELAATVLAGKEVGSAEGCPIRRLPGDAVVVDVPFPGREGTVVVHLVPTETPAYVDLAPPRVEGMRLEGTDLLVATDRPTRVVVFAASGRKGLRDARPVARRHQATRAHRIALPPAAGPVLYVGAITEWEQSALAGPLAVAN